MLHDDGDYYIDNYRVAKKFCIQNGRCVFVYEISESRQLLAVDFKLWSIVSLAFFVINWWIMLLQTVLALPQIKTITKTNSQFCKFCSKFPKWSFLLPFVLVSIFSSPALFATMFLPFEGFLEVTVKERITVRPWLTMVFDVSKKC